MPPKKKKNKTNEIDNIRKKQLEEITSVISIIEEKIEKSIESQRKKLPMLDSVSKGLYEELDKLCKKAPAESITDLILEKVNDIIKETRLLAQKDPFVQKLNEFIPAGDNPQQRDVVVVLRQVRQGLNRYRDDIDEEIKNLKVRTDEAKGIQMALYIYIEDEEDATDEYLEEYNILKRKQWFTGYDPAYFNYDKLNEININKYFLEDK